MTAVLRTLIDKLSRELEPLLESGDNWQVAVHGGRGGDVVVKVERTHQVVGGTRPDATQQKPLHPPTPDNCHG